MHSQKSPPYLIIISSPSGAGKSTICKMLVERNSNIKLSISATTRKKRPGETDGKDYYFISQNKFDEMVEDDSFLEHAHVFEHNYGTPKAAVENQLENNNHVLFDIDWQGARQIVSKFNKNQIITIFILPPSIEELHRRLQNRAQDSEEVVLKRMQKAKDEMSHWDEYGHILVNQNLEITYQKIQKIIQSPGVVTTEHKEIKSLIKDLLQ